MFSDNEDEAIALLKSIEEQVGGGGGSQIDIEVDEEALGGSTELFSTGPTRLALDSTEEWEPLEFGFSARTINIRTTDAILVAFSKRGRNNGGHIKVRGTESPFTIGGDAGINASTLWVRKADTASSDPGIEIIAYR